MEPQALLTGEAAFVTHEPRPNEPRTTRRIQHRCGRFLAELRNGVLYVMCVRCKDLVAVQLNQPSEERFVHEGDHDTLNQQSLRT
ncbi:MAG: hypothetical protein Q8R91_10710 [Candidatus Omnitrophota bacterium]|nr:hypothetical protein [Candidatus Omnitrophota bacterium]